jgi:hypothetical protein
MATENNYIIKKVSIVDTFRNMPIGKPMLFDCREFAKMTAAASAVSRLNITAGKKIYSISTEDNGITYTVLRKE